MDLHTSDTFNIELQGDRLSIDINDMVDTQELDVRLQQDDELDVNLQSEDELEVKMVEGMPTPIDDYNLLRNHPSVNGVELKGDKSFEDLGRNKITNMDLKKIIDEQYELIFGGGNNG